MELVKRPGAARNLVSLQLIEQYSMSVARWIQLEQLISRTGFVGKHPTTGAAIASPIVSMSQAYLKQANQLWYQIYQIVQENCSTPFKGNSTRGCHGAAAE